MSKEKTAMDLLIEWAETQPFGTGYVSRETVLKKAKELRDTVEKETLIAAHMRSGERSMIRWEVRREYAEKWYNKKYGNDE